MFLLAAVALVASACARTPSLPSAGNPPDVSSDQPVAGGGPCRLLKVGEVELALNVSVGGIVRPARTRPVLAGMAMCSAHANRTVASWGVLSSKAAERFHEYRDLNGEYLDSRRVRGLPALWDDELHSLVVLAGSRALAVRLTVEKPALPKGADVEAYLERTATQLSERALARLGR